MARRTIAASHFSQHRTVRVPSAPRNNLLAKQHLARVLQCPDQRTQMAVHPSDTDVRRPCALKSPVTPLPHALRTESLF